MLTFRLAQPDAHAQARELLDQALSGREPEVKSATVLEEVYSLLVVRGLEARFVRGDRGPEGGYRAVTYDMTELRQALAHGVPCLPPEG